MPAVFFQLSQSRLLNPPPDGRSASSPSFENTSNQSSPASTPAPHRLFDRLGKATLTHSTSPSCSKSVEITLAAPLRCRQSPLTQWVKGSKPTTFGLFRRKPFLLAKNSICQRCRTPVSAMAPSRDLAHSVSVSHFCGKFTKHQIPPNPSIRKQIRTLMGEKSLGL